MVHDVNKMIDERIRCGVCDGQGALVEADEVGAHAGHTHVRDLQHLRDPLVHRTAQSHIGSTVQCEYEITASSGSEQSLRVCAKRGK